jgi:hypothetical protein
VQVGLNQSVSVEVQIESLYSKLAGRAPLAINGRDVGPHRVSGAFLAGLMSLPNNCPDSRLSNVFNGVAL